jgi:hypothetical protein
MLLLGFQKRVCPLAAGDDVFIGLTLHAYKCVQVDFGKWLPVGQHSNGL